jgi:hypothetical protein
MDNSKFQYEGMKWLMELELLNHPQAINTIKFNIMMTSNQIKEVELLIYRENKTMLVLLELTWFGQKFFKKRIFSEVQDILTQLLPSFQFRVTENPEIMKLAVERLKKALIGGINENSYTTSNGASNSVSDRSGIEPSPGTKAPDGIQESTGSSSEEQSQTEQTVRKDISQNDPKEE